MKVFIATLYAAFAFSLVAQHATVGNTTPNVITFGSGNPTNNTTAPTGALTGSGWDFEGTWGPCLGTAIAPQFFITAKHVGGEIGNAFTYHTVVYHTTAFWDEPYSDLRIWRIDGVFPAYAT